MKGKQLSKKKLALGKGIASLLEANTYEMDTEELRQAISRQAAIDPDSSMLEVRSEDSARSSGPQMVNIQNISVNPYQPRKVFKEEALRELADSIIENGLIQPVIVSEKAGGQFEIISGERRLRACKIAGLQQVSVLVKRVTDRERLAMAIVENIQRSNLNCIEEALAYFQLMDEFKLSQEEVAKKMGKERSTVANFLRVLKLPREVVELLQREELSFGHGKVLTVLKDPAECTRIARQVYKEGLSVRQAEALIKKGGRPTTKGGLLSSNGLDASRLDSLRGSLEKKTGHHFALKPKRDGSGQIIIKYNNKTEFNAIFEYLMR